jgi:dipeptidyl aminopeptidase/acylaminoacyl peptidase
VRQAVGIEHAEPALFALPAPGRLLVVSAENGGTWLVKANGFMRKLGPYSDAEWSPHGLYVIATEPNELVAFDPDGDVRWKLARHDPSWPRWEGTMTDTRIAYIASSGLRVVAGDGTGDHLLDAHAGDVPPVWDPARLHTVAYYSGGAIVVRSSDGPLVWRTSIKVTPSDLEWSSDGRYLAVVSPKQIVVIDGRGHVHRTISMLGAELRQAAFKPGTHEIAVVVRTAGRSEVRIVDVDRPGHARLLFAGPGTFGDVEWSPAGDWLLVNWPDANQWVFIKGKQVRAVANIRQQFARADGLGPMLELSGRWCCAK